MGYLNLFRVLMSMITVIYKRMYAKFRTSLLANIGTQIPVRLWNKGPM